MRSRPPPSLGSALSLNNRPSEAICRPLFSILVRPSKVLYFLRPPLPFQRSTHVSTSARKGPPGPYKSLHLPLLKIRIFFPSSLRSSTHTTRTLPAPSPLLYPFLLLFSEVSLETFFPSAALLVVGIDWPGDWFEQRIPLMCPGHLKRAWSFYFIPSVLSIVRTFDFLDNVAFRVAFSALRLC